MKGRGVQAIIHKREFLCEKREEILQKYGQIPGSDQIIKGPLEMLIF